MIGLTCVRDIARPQSWHMTVNARSLCGLNRLLVEREGAALVLMTSETPAIKKIVPLFRGRSIVRIVARDAAEPRAARLIAATGMHLHRLRDGCGRFSVCTIPFHEYGPDVAEFHSRSKIGLHSAIAQESLFALKVTLKADGVSLGGG